MSNTDQPALPDSNPEIAAFRKLLGEGRFCLPVCGACGKSHWYPRAFCPFCFSEDITANESSGEGVIYSYSVMHSNPPVAMAYVKINDGPTLLTNLVDMNAAQIAIGMKVKPTWSSRNGDSQLLVFTTA
jgi:uncharacterized OB-fold protein